VRGEINSSHSALADFTLDFVFPVKRLPDDASAIHILFAKSKSV